METIKWDESLSVKIESFDYQHKKLVALINEFYEYIKTGSQKEKIQPIIKSLKEYTLYHFSSEEKQMKLLKYQGYEAHKKEHDAFVAKVLDLESRYNSGKLIVSVEITNFIKDWITKHIMGTDKKYSDFMLSHGVK